MQEQRSDNGTEDATRGSTSGPRTEGELPEFPVAGYPERYLLEDGRPFPRIPEIPLLLDGRPAIGHLERFEPERPDTPTGVAGFPAREGFHEVPGQGPGPDVLTYRVPTSEGPPSSSEGRRSSAFQQSSSSGRSELKGTMSLTLTLPGEDATTLEGSLTLETPEGGRSKKSGNKMVEKEENEVKPQELDEEKSRLKQRILAAAKIAPGAANSSSSRASKAEQEEREKQEMRVAFEEGGEAVGRSRATSSMEMTAMDFRAIVASDEARAFRQEAARQRIRDMEAASIREEATRQRSKELQIPKAASMASGVTRGEEEGQRYGEVPRSGSSGDQVQRTTSLPSSSTRVATEQTLEHPDCERLDDENDRTLEAQRMIPENPWNAFQQANRGRGWSQKKMQEEYWSQKGRGKGDKSGKP